MTRLSTLICALCVAACASQRSAPSPAAGKNDRSGAAASRMPSAMSNTRLGKLLRRFDANLQHEGATWQFQIENRQVIVITDERADRMRIMSPITEIASIDNDILQRMMQANFDSALDARYSVARDVVWSAFIHPLSSLSDKELFSGLAQVVNLVATFGTTYSSGALVFGGGDSEHIQRERYEEIMRKGGVEI